MNILSQDIKVSEKPDIKLVSKINLLYPKH